MVGEDEYGNILWKVGCGEDLAELKDHELQTAVWHNSRQISKVSQFAWRPSACTAWFVKQDFQLIFVVPTIAAQRGFVLEGYVDKSLVSRSFYQRYLPGSTKWNVPL